MTPSQERFVEIIQLIKNSRTNAIRHVNTALINLNWNIGKYISEKVERSEWGQAVVKELALHILKTEPELKGYSDKNLWRMKQFYEVYRDEPKLSPLLREISWTNNVVIMNRAKNREEKEFYLKRCIRERYSSRELERQINSGVFERTLLGAKLSAPLREMYPNIKDAFKDGYVFDFLNIKEPYSESDLQKALVRQMKEFLVELGKDFLFMDQEFRVQVGNNDFFIDLLFFHRGLQCLVAIELKADKFRPDYLGQINFYLEALDRDIKKPHENPSIGILLCKDQDKEVVEYALSRSLSPTLISEYKMQLPDKKILQQKLHEIFNEVPESKM